MSFKVIREIPSPEEIKKMSPMPEDLKKLKAEKDKELKDILAGKVNKIIAIVGPCSADNEDAVCEYISRLKKVNEKISDKVFIIPRVYTGKPRTTGAGYKGMLHQPDPTKEPNMVDGILAIRHMDIRALREGGMPLADEMLYTENFSYVDDLLSYIAVGARSVENQDHRLTASGIDVPVGMKNPTSGDLAVMFNSIQAAQTSHNFIHSGCEVLTSGNPFAHVIMRGSVNKHGENISNYHYEDLMRAINIYKEKGFENPSIIVDVNHSNSGKKFYEQPRIIKEVIHNRKFNMDIRKTVKGFMIESYLVEGNQKIEEDRVYGKSITDPCLGWEETEDMLYYIADRVYDI